ncbi:MAG: LysR family transcriptional regulator [Pseudomonadota bacterium]
MDRLRDMEIFATVAEEGSFAAAARRLRLSPPAVTRAVAGLEDRLGVRLIQRTTRSMRLTDAGERFRVSALRILADIDGAEREAAGEMAAPRGHFSVTASPTFGRLVVGQVIARFLAAQPEVSATLFTADRIVNLVEEGIDIGVRIGNIPDSSLIGRRVGHVRRMLVASPSYLAEHGRPQTPQDLKTHRVIGFTGLMQTRVMTFHRAGESHPVTLSPQLELNDAAAGIALAEAGEGIAMAYCYALHEPVTAGRLVEVLHDHAQPARPVHVLYPEGRLPAPAVRAFLDFAIPELQAALDYAIDFRTPAPAC